MTTYYVSPSGSDANNGLGPDASAGTNKPWLTIGKALGAAGVASGDTVYVGPGTYREVVAVAMTSATVETKVLGDPANAQGFKDGSGVRLASGPVIHTGYLTNDKTAPSATTLLNLSGRDFLTFQNVLFVGGNATIVTATTTTSTSILFIDCGFVVGMQGNWLAVDATTVFGTALTWTMDRCYFEGTLRTTGSVPAIRVNLPSGSGADYDAAFVVTNSTFISSGINVLGSGAGAQKGGGVVARNCDFHYCTAMNTGPTTTLSTSIPCLVANSKMFSGGQFVGLAATTLGQLTESYNFIRGSSARTNVNVGTGSLSDGSYAPLYHFGQERIWGGAGRPFGEPMAGSPLLGFGNDGSQSAADLGGNPRPAGGASASPATGALERSNTFARETGTVRTGANAVSITGPGYQDFDVPVNAVSTTLSVYVRWDATYAGTKPKMQVWNGTECGVSDATATATGSSGAWEQLSLNFTPTAAGIVTIRLLSSDTNGAGVMFADDFAAA